MAVDAYAIIGGTNYTGSILSVSRVWSFKRVTQTFELFLDPGASYSAIQPGQAVTIFENGTLVLTGLTDGKEPSRDPPRIRVFGRDRFKLAQDYFVTEDLITSGSQSAAYWVDYFCTLVGLSYGILGTSGSPILSAEVPIIRRFVSEILEDICARIGWQMRIATSGSLQFLSLTAPVTMDYNLTADMKSGNIEVSDATTRDKFYVWGWSNTSGSPIRVVSERPIAGLPALPDRVGVFASPNIGSVAQASAIAEAALDQFASLDRIGKVSIIGNPAMIVGQAAQATVMEQSVASTITDISSEVDEGGHRMSLMIGRRNPRLPRWPVSSGSPRLNQIWITSGSDPSQFFDVTAYDDGVYACGSGAGNSDGAVHRHRLDNGNLVWRSTRSDQAYRTIVTDSSGVYVGNNDALGNFQVVKFDLDGVYQWTTSGSPGVCRDLVSGSDGNLYACGDVVFGTASGKYYVCRINKSTGAFVWHFTSGNGTCYTLAEYGGGLLGIGVVSAIGATFHISTAGMLIEDYFYGTGTVFQQGIFETQYFYGFRSIFAFDVVKADAFTGAIVWQTTIGETARHTSVSPSWTYHSSEDIFGLSKVNGALYWIETARDYRRYYGVWANPIGGIVLGCGGKVNATAPNVFNNAFVARFSEE